MGRLKYVLHDKTKPRMLLEVAKLTKMCLNSSLLTDSRSCGSGWLSRVNAVEADAGPCSSTRVRSCCWRGIFLSLHHATPHSRIHPLLPFS